MTQTAEARSQKGGAGVKSIPPHTDERLSPAPLQTKFPTRQQLEVERDRLRCERGGAALDNLPFDDTRLDAIERALAVVDDVDQVAHERGRRAADDAERQRVATLRAEIKQADSERLAALADAETAYGFAIERLGRFTALSEQIRVAGNALGSAPQLAFDWREVERRVSRWLIPGLTALGRIQELGDVTWHGTAEPCEGWAAAERRSSDAALSLLLAAPAAADSQQRNANLEIVTEGAE